MFFAVGVLIVTMIVAAVLPAFAGEFPPKPGQSDGGPPMVAGSGPEGPGATVTPCIGSVGPADHGAVVVNRNGTVAKQGPC
jgi:hypothetical protein